MKGKRFLLIGLVLGGAMGWALGYLRLPQIGRHHAFWVGFGTCLAVVSFLLAFYFVWKKNSELNRQLNGGSSPNGATRNYLLVWMLVSGFIVAGGLASSYMVYRQNKLLTAQTKDQNRRLEEQAEMIGSIRKANSGLAMGNVLDRMDADLQQHPDRSLSPATVSRIAALAYSLKPYRYFEGERLSENALSPERGQLLLALAHAGMDSASFAQVKAKTTFAGSDLRDADLTGMDLSGVDLRGADLRNADLTATNLSLANLEEAQLAGAKLNQAQLVGCNLRKTELSWVEAKSANLQQANLNGARAGNIQLQQSNLTGATFRWAKANGAMLNQAVLTEVDLFGTQFSRANFEGADLQRTDLRKAVLSEANLQDTDLAQATVRSEDWIARLEDQRILGYEALKNNYSIEKDTSNRYQFANWRLKKLLP